MTKEVRISAQPPSHPGPHAVERRHRWRLYEVLPWILALAVYVLFPGYLALGTQTLIMVLFALSLDLLLGYAGIVTLGHAVFFGIGAYVAGILSVKLGVTEPLTGLAAALLVAGAVGLGFGAAILRARGLTFLMLTLTLLLTVAEFANKAAWLTGGADGLQGITVAPVFGQFRFDMFGRTAYLYALGVLFVAFVAIRALVHSPFGRSLIGIRENGARMEALGTPVRARLTVGYGIAAMVAGLAGAVSAHTTQFVALNTLSFELSGAVLVMLIVGGTGRLYGAFVGAPAYMIAQDYLARLDPSYWYCWIGAFLVAVVMLGRGGILGLASDATRRLRPRAAP